MGFRMRGAVPLEGERQAFFKTDLRTVPEKFPRSGDVCLGVADVPLSRRVVLRFQGLAGNPCESQQNLIERDTSAGADVGDSSRKIWRFARQKDCQEGSVA